MSTSWADLRAAWSAGWRRLQDEAVRAHGAAVTSNPASFAPRVVVFQAELATSRATLNRVREKLAHPAATAADRSRYAALERRYHELAAGLFAEATPATQTVIGVAPIVVAGGIAVAVVGVCWSIAAYQYAVNLREQTALGERELDARVAASQDGRVLQPSTLPPPAPPPGSDSNLGLWVLGGLAVVTGVAVLPSFLKK